MITFIILVTTFVKVENALLAFVGLFICFKGHRYYHTNLFVMGSVTGTFVSYVLLTKFLPTEVGKSIFGLF